MIVCDPVQDLEWADKFGIKFVDLPTLLTKSDIISLHVPLTPETFHLLNDQTFEKMKQKAFIINTSRGKVIDTAAMIKALKSGHLGGVALDTYEEEEGIFFEDLSDRILLDDDLSRLLTFPNVLITAHQGFFTHEALTEIARITTTNIQALMKNNVFIPGTILN